MRRLRAKKHQFGAAEWPSTLGEHRGAAVKLMARKSSCDQAALRAAGTDAVSVTEISRMSWWNGKKSTEPGTPPHPAGDPHLESPAAGVPSVAAETPPSPPAQSGAEYQPPTAVSTPCEVPPAPPALASPRSTGELATSNASGNEPDATAQPGQELLQTLMETQQQLVREQAGLREQFDARMRSDEVQNRALDRLLDELRDYKSNFVRQQQQPLLREIIDCYDFATRESLRLSNPAPDGEAGTGTTGAASLGVLSQMLIDLLSRYDIEPYRHDGPQFDGKWQQCVKTVPCDALERDKQVAETGAIGFRQGDLIIRREQVVVYKYRAG